MTVRKYYPAVIRSFLTLAIIDFDGDFLLRQEIGLFSFIQDLVRYGIVVLLLIIGIAGLSNITLLARVKAAGLVCLGVVLVTFTYGFIYGVLANNPNGAIRECLAISPLLLILLLLNVERREIYNIAKYFIHILVWICAVKMVLSQIVSISVYGSLSWKVFLRASILLLIPYVYFFTIVIKGDATRKDVMFLVLVTIEIFMTQARTLNVCVLLATLFVISQSKFDRRVFFPLAVIASAMAVAMIFTANDIGMLLEIWSGDHYDSSSGYRQVQLEVLIDRYNDRPLTGFGFGYYTPGYETYADLANSFLLELDIINFSTKIGIPLFLMYVFTYIFFVLQYKRGRYFDGRSRAVALAYVMALLLILFYSLFQTAHSSIFYWIVYAMAFTLVFVRPRRESALS